MFNMTLRGPYKDEVKIFNIYEQDIIYYAMIWPSSSIQLNNLVLEFKASNFSDSRLVIGFTERGY